MRRVVSGNMFLLFAMLLLIASVVVAIVSLFPVFTGEKATRAVIDDCFGLTPSETRRQGLGSFRGGENISVHALSTTDRLVNLTVISYGGASYSPVSAVEIEFSFTAEPDYYEAIFAGSNTENDVLLKVFVEDSEALFPFAWLSIPAKIGFFISCFFVMLLLLKTAYTESFNTQDGDEIFLSKKSRQTLLILLAASFLLWLAILTVNTNPLGTFENWYTDNARNSYSATLFTKVGFSIFDTPLGQLASVDSSYYKFVTWPEMPHLYPLGSVFLFLPFGFLLQEGVSQVLVFKMEIVLFLVFSHVGMYFFLKHFWTQRISLPLKLVGAYVIYVALIVCSANGMFDSVAFLLAMIGLSFFIAGRYDFFVLLIVGSAFLKYQAGMFLLPLLVVGLVRLLGNSGLSAVSKSKMVLAAVFPVGATAFTAFLSWSYVGSVRSEFVMNGVNAFSSHSQIPWMLQSLEVLLTLAITFVFAVYMFHKNSLLSLSAVFMLLPAFTLPYFQVWYLP